MKRRVILAVAQDAGPANALVPVIRELSRRTGIEVLAVATGKAAEVFSREGIRHQVVEMPSPQDGEGVAFMLDLLRQASPDLLMMGSAWGHSLDKWLLKVSGDIPSVSVIDNWSFFTEKFTDPSTGERILPHRVCLADEWARQEAIRQGLPESLLVVTGQPYLDALPARMREPVFQNQAASLRRKWLKTASDRVVVFASEAFSRYGGPDTPYYRGYTEIDALEGLVEAVRRIEDTADLHFEIIVKLHPEESLGSFRPGPQAKERGVPIYEGQPSFPFILAADIVVGMASVFLIEASIAGRTAISFQPNAQGAYPFIGCQMGLVFAASSVQELGTLLKSSGSESPQPFHGNGSFAPGDAAHRIVETALDLIPSRHLRKEAFHP